MMCMTELHGGVCHRTSTPHKSGNKMKEKKKKKKTVGKLEMGGGGGGVRIFWRGFAKRGVRTNPPNPPPPGYGPAL